MSLNSNIIKLSSDTGGDFFDNVTQGLRSNAKRLSSKYFYDEKGDKLFQQIMGCPEYYLTRSELSIFKEDTASLAAPLLSMKEPLDIIELGAGDGTKTVFLLDYLIKRGKDFKYYPIDISGSILSELDAKLSSELPTLDFETVEGEYFKVLERVTSASLRQKLVLFLGSNIGNMTQAEAQLFCQNLRKFLCSGDMVLIGFDLRKNPQTILDAYNDAAGFTRDFNLNLLERINRELKADFNIGQFSHYPMYDPETGSCRSYLVSLCHQSVTIGDEAFTFHEGEYIHTETSQKYELEEIRTFAANSHFQSVIELTDSKKWFADVYWQAI